MKIIKVIHDEEKFDALSSAATSFDINIFTQNKSTNIIAEVDEEIKKSQQKKNQYPLLSALVDIAISSIASTPQISDELLLEKYKFANRERDKLLIKKVAEEMRENLEETSKEISILTLSSAREKYHLTRNLTIGSYTLHPREPKMLTKLADFHKNLALEKDDELIMLLGKMGATSVKISQAAEMDENKDAAVFIDANIIEASAKATYNTSTKASQHLSVEFEGKNNEIPNDLLSSSIWFADDSRLLSIFESRKLGVNRIKEYHLINTYSDSFDFDFDAAAKFIKTSVDIKARFNSIKNQARLFTVKF